jgi:hypothetical protein
MERMYFTEINFQKESTMYSVRLDLQYELILVI